MIHKHFASAWLCLATATALTGCQPKAEAPAPAAAPVAAAAAEAPAAPAVALPTPATTPAANPAMPSAMAAKPLPEGATLPPGHPPIGPSAEVAVGEFPAADLRIADLRAKRGEKANQSVQIRGRVVKVNSGILGRNWLHLQDGTEGKLVVTTTAEVAVGALVLVKGTVLVDHDVGAGYKYDVLLQDAVVVEQSGSAPAPAPAPAPH